MGFFLKFVAILQTTVVMTIPELLSHRIHKRDIQQVTDQAANESNARELLYRLSESPDERLSTNALWCMASLPASASAWVQSLQNVLIDRLLVETHPSKKRIILQLLRRQTFDSTTIRTDFLDYCFSKINSQSEAYAVRSFCIYCAFKMCRFYPELIAELEGHLDMLSHQDLSPGLRSALRTTRKDIASIGLIKR